MEVLSFAVLSSHLQVVGSISRLETIKMANADTIMFCCLLLEEHLPLRHDRCLDKDIGYGKQPLTIRNMFRL